MHTGGLDLYLSGEIQPCARLGQILFDQLKQVGTTLLQSAGEDVLPGLIQPILQFSPLQLRQLTTAAPGLERADTLIEVDYPAAL